MSHRAIIALKTGPESYDLHYSHNGALDLHLTPVLEDHLAGETNDLDAVAESDVNQIPQLQKWGAAADIGNDDRVTLETPEKEAIDPQPMAHDIPLKYIGAGFDYDDIEVFYRVANGRVETYVPVWLYPNVVRPWRNELTVEVYRSGNLPDDPYTMVEELENSDPIRVIDEDMLHGNDWADDTIVWDVLLRNHEAVYAQQRRVARNDEFKTNHEDFSGQSMLTTESRVMVIDGPIAEPVTPDPQAKGVLVQIDNENTSQYANVRDTANEARIEIGTRLNMTNDPPTDDEIHEEQQTMLVELLKSYRSRIAAFSPPPYGPLAEEIRTRTN